MTTLVIYFPLSSKALQTNTDAGKIALERAESFVNQRNSDSAAFYYKEAIAQFLLSENYDQLLYSELRYVKLLNRTGDFRTIIDRMLSMRKLADSVGMEESANLAYTLEKIAMAYDKSGRHFRSHEYFIKFLNLVKEKSVTDTTYMELIGKTYNNLAVSLMRSGRLELADVYFDSAIYELQKQNLVHTELAHVIYLNKGNVNKNLGYFDESLLFYSKSLSMLDIPSIDKIEKGLAWWYFADFYLKKNQDNSDLVLAKQYSDTAAMYLHEVPALYLYIYYQLAGIYDKTGAYEKGLAELNKAEEYILANYGPGYYELADVHAMRAGILIRMEDYARAMESIRESIRYYEVHYPENTEMRSQAYLNMGNCYAKQNMPVKALATYQHGISVLFPHFDPTDLLGNPDPDSLFRSVSLYETLKQKSTQYDHLYSQTDSLKYLEAQLSCYELMISEIDLGRQAMIEIESRMNINEQRYSVYESAVAACYTAYEKTGNTDYLTKAFNYSYASKASELRDKIQNANHRNLGNASHNNLLVQISDLRLLVGQLKKDIALTDNSKRKRALKDDLFDSQSKLRSLSDSVKHKLSELYGSESFGPDIERLTHALQKQNTLLVEYMQAGDDLIIFTIGEKLQAMKIPFDTAMQKELISYKKSIENRDTQFSISQKIYNTILAPAITEHEFDQLHIIPDGALTSISFGSLVTEVIGSSTNRYLIEDYPVTYSYSSLFVQSHSPEITDYEYDFIGFSPGYTHSGELITSALRSVLEEESLYALPFAQQEVAGITKITTGKHLDGPEATESNFKKLAGSSRYLHIAGHAISDHVQPMLSKVLFSEANGTKEDGIAYAYEIYNMNLPANMVVLSACNTGTGRFRKGEGLISLANSFMYAGSENLITSLWSVPDQPTSLIVTDFYRNIENGLSKSEALRQAKLDYLRKADTNTADPYYWSGFILIGNHDEKPGSPLLRTVFIAMLIGLSAVILYFRLRR